MPPGGRRNRPAQSQRLSADRSDRPKPDFHASWQHASPTRFVRPGTSTFENLSSRPTTPTCNRSRRTRSKIKDQAETLGPAATRSRPCRLRGTVGDLLFSVVLGHQDPQRCQEWRWDCLGNRRTPEDHRCVPPRSCSSPGRSYRATLSAGPASPDGRRSVARASETGRPGPRRRS